MCACDFGGILSSLITLFIYEFGIIPSMAGLGRTQVSYWRDLSCHTSRALPDSIAKYNHLGYIPPPRYTISYLHNIPSTPSPPAEQKTLRYLRITTPFPTRNEYTSFDFFLNKSHTKSRNATLHSPTPTQTTSHSTSDIISCGCPAAYSAANGSFGRDTISLVDLVGTERI